MVDIAIDKPWLVLWFAFVALELIIYMYSALFLPLTGLELECRSLRDILPADNNVRFRLFVAPALPRIGAAAGVGGQVFVSTSIANGELGGEVTRFILLHEIGHVACRHHVRQFFFATSCALLAALALQAAMAAVGFWAALLFAPAALIAVGFVKGVNLRMHEREADAYATKICGMQTAAAVLAMFPDQDEGTSTHPSPRARLAALVRRFGAESK